MLAGCMIDSLNAWSNHVSSLTFRAPRKRFASRTSNPVFVAGLKQRQSLKYVLVYISGSVSNLPSCRTTHHRSTSITEKWTITDTPLQLVSCRFQFHQRLKLTDITWRKKNNPSQILSWTSSPDCDEGESAQLISTHGISDGSRKNMTVTVKRKLKLQTSNCQITREGFVTSESLTQIKLKKRRWRCAMKARMLADVSGHDYCIQCHQPGNSQDVYKARQAAHWNSKKITELW